MDIDSRMAAAPRREPNNVFLNLLRPKPTGRLLVTFDPDLDLDARRSIVERASGPGVQALGIPSLEGLAADPGSSSALLGRFGFAVVDEPDAQRSNVLMNTLGAEKGVKGVRPEFYLFATEIFEDSSDRTWGVDSTLCTESPFTGKGIRIAILDTGIDEKHPDFAGRRIVTKSFVDGESADDGQGHGTHCAGIAVGRTKGNGGLRYGAAPEADLYIGKVLNNQGAGREADIIAGILWAIEQKCEVISMSLGRAVRESELFTPEYEEAAKQALAAGSLIVAAAGNNSTRQFGFVAPVSSPANCPSIMAVGALDVDLSVAYFSNGTINAEGGRIDLVGPGVSVISSFPLPKKFEKLSGTSMACPFVAGIAALWAESHPSLRGPKLYAAVLGSARGLSHSPEDVGAGLAQAPVADIMAVA